MVFVVSNIYISDVLAQKTWSKLQTLNDRISSRILPIKQRRSCQNVNVAFGYQDYEVLAPELNVSFLLFNGR